MNIYMYTHIYIYIYIYMYGCVVPCCLFDMLVCMRVLIRSWIPLLCVPPLWGMTRG